MFASCFYVLFKFCFMIEAIQGSPFVTSLQCLFFFEAITLYFCVLFEFCFTREGTQGPPLVNIRLYILMYACMFQLTVHHADPRHTHTGIFARPSVSGRPRSVPTFLAKYDSPGPPGRQGHLVCVCLCVCARTSKCVIVCVCVCMRVCA